MRSKKFIRQWFFFLIVNLQAYHCLSRLLLSVNIEIKIIKTLNAMNAMNNMKTFAFGGWRIIRSINDA